MVPDEEADDGVSDMYLAEAEVGDGEIITSLDQPEKKEAGTVETVASAISKGLKASDQTKPATAKPATATQAVTSAAATAAGAAVAGKSAMIEPVAPDGTAARLTEGGMAPQKTFGQKYGLMLAIGAVIVAVPVGMMLFMKPVPKVVPKPTPPKPVPVAKTVSGAR